MSKRTITEIWIYPVKSLGGIRLQSARVLPKGLEYDRRWMLIDSDNRFITQRTHPELALFKLCFESGNLTIRYSDQHIPLPFQPESDRMTAQVWNDIVEVYEVGKGHSNWFSNIMGMDCRLVAFPEISPRAVDPGYALHSENVSLADAYPLLLVGQSSLDDLNRRMQWPLPMNRFRPNIVFEGGDPYEEDGWKNFKIGRNRFAGVKACSRCVITTVDQDTGRKGIEPLATLATYRRKDNKVYFGQNLLPLDHYEIAEGDEVVLL